MEGSATLTIATSSTTISCAVAMTARAIPDEREERVWSIGVSFFFLSRDACESQELLDAEGAELKALVARKGSRRGGVVDDLGVGDLLVATAVRHDRAPGGGDVAVPGGVLAEGQGHDVSPGMRPHAQRRRVRATCGATAMVKDAHDRHPPPAGDEQHERVDETGDRTDGGSGSRTEMLHGPRTRQLPPV